MVPVIDLRRFVRAGDRVLLVSPDGRDVHATFTHVSTQWASADVPRGVVGVSETLRAALTRDGTRLAVTFEALDVRELIESDSVELTVVAAAVLGNRPAARATVPADAAVAIFVDPDEHVVRVPVQIVAMDGDGLDVICADRFAPGDEITIAREGADAFRVRVRVVRRAVESAAAARFACRVVAATSDDEERLRALVGTV
jgi:hypothetical protein